MLQFYVVHVHVYTYVYMSIYKDKYKTSMEFLYRCIESFLKIEVLLKMYILFEQPKVILSKPNYTYKIYNFTYIMWKQLGNKYVSPPVLFS